MLSSSFLDQLSETILQDERILTPAERDLLGTLVKRASDSGGRLSANLARALGETVAQRAFAILGNSKRTGAQTVSSSIFTRQPTEWVVQGGEIIKFTVTKNNKIQRDD